MKWLDVLLIAALILAVMPASGQLPAAEAFAPQAEAESPSGAETGDGEDAAFEEIEQILREEEDMIRGAYTYDPGTRRDPFVSLLRRVAAPRDGQRTGECPTGCLIDEVTLTGVFVMPEGPVAQIQSPDQEKSYLIRVGDEFFDGEVVAISADGVRFRQVVNDFQEVKPFREVFKELNP